MERDKMTILEILERATPPTYETTLSNGKRLALWPEMGQVDLEDILGDLIGVQTLSIDRFLSEIQTNDKHRDPIAEIIERHGGQTTETETAISKHLDRAGMNYQFVSLRGYSQGDWAEVVIYAESETVGNLNGAADELRAWFRGDIFTLCLEDLKTYTAPDGESLARWEVEDALGGMVISESYGLKNRDIDWDTLALDAFGLDITKN
jgi:hypothetical protein